MSIRRLFVAGAAGLMAHCSQPFIHEMLIGLIKKLCKELFAAFRFLFVQKNNF